MLDALDVGYRSIDTAQAYYNEEQVGSAIKKSGILREEIFLTTKVWLEHFGGEAAYRSVLESMEKLKTDYLDLVLLHQPFGDAYGAWRALENLGAWNVKLDDASFAALEQALDSCEVRGHRGYVEATSGQPEVRKK